MISRIYVWSPHDNRGKTFLKSWSKLGLSGKISDVKILDCYLLQGEISKDAVLSAAGLLTNPSLEKFSIDKIQTKKVSYVVEIGFKPGVTDNVGHTACETISDSLRLDKESLAIYSSKIFLISGRISRSDANKIALALHNPLIERSTVIEGKKFTGNLPLETPEVVLNQRTPVISVSLDVSDRELATLGKEGIREGDTLRGPWALGLPEMKAIQEYFSKLDRQPTDIEMESLAQTWSEHCKHTIFASPIDEIKDGLYKTFIKGATSKIRQNKGKNDFCVSVFSDNAGAIAFDDEYLITHKVETHNTPSALDPYGGAITGIGGVNRDCIGFGLGAKPVANTYGFCLGEPEEKRVLYRDKDKKQKLFPPKRIMEGVIKGINAGGNCSGIPTLSGFVRFDERYRGKPLVFAGTVGLIPRKNRHRPLHDKKAEVGDYIVMVGGRVGADGIHGATFSSEVMDSKSPSTAVQIGDPIAQKKLSDVLVKEARDMNLYSSITDNGAGGLSCSVAEMARECGGAKIDLEKVPLKYPGLRPWEIWISESQERMTLSVPKKKWRVFASLLESRGVEATVIGEFTDSGKITVRYNGNLIMNMSLEFLHNGWPRKQLRTASSPAQHPEPKLPRNQNITEELERLTGALNTGGMSFISDQYDHEVQAGSVLKPLSGRGRINTDAQVFRPLLSSAKGAVVSYGVYPNYSDIDTYHMASSAIDTAIRSAVCAGAPLNHLAILDNFCWCSSDEKGRLRELKDAVSACQEYAVGYGTPFISGKDSMFNDFKGYDGKGNPIKISVPPTLLISAIGVMPDLHKTVSPEFKRAGDIIYLLGETHNELGGSEYYRMLGAIGNSVPKVDWKKNMKVYSVLESAINKELVASAISVALGGLGVALARTCVGGMLGAEINVRALPGGAGGSRERLFSESQGRVLVSVAPKNASEFEKMIKRIPHAKLGSVDDSGKLVITEDQPAQAGKKIVDTPVKKLHAFYHKFSDSMR